MPDGNTTVIIQGKNALKPSKSSQKNPTSEVQFQNFLKMDDVVSEEFTTIIEELKALALRIIKESPNIPFRSFICGQKH